jgi:large subunit ribosomal protein L1
MPKLGKRILEERKCVPKGAIQAVEAFDLIKKHAKGFESVDVVFKLGIDPKKSDQVVKGVLEVVPAGLGKGVSIAVFSNIDHEALKSAGASFVGMDDLIAEIKSGKVEYDVYMASRESMPALAKQGLGRLLKGKMPNPKLGTVVDEKDMVSAVKSQSAGQIAFRSNGKLVHSSIGRSGFSSEDLVKNFEALLAEVIKSRPTVVKEHQYLKGIFCSSTMGAGFEIVLPSVRGGK